MDRGMAAAGQRSQIANSCRVGWFGRPGYDRLGWSRVAGEAVLIGIKGQSFGAVDEVELSLASPSRSPEILQMEGRFENDILSGIGELDDFGVGVVRELTAASASG